MFESVRKELEELGWPSGNALKAPDIKKRIEEATSFLDPSKIKKPSQRLFCLYFNIQHTPKCIECGKDCSYSSKKINPSDAYAGWTLYCSKECAYSSDKRNEKKNTTMIKRYGAENPSQVKELREKVKKTMLDRYGVEYPTQVEEFKDKAKKTNSKRYGTEHPMKNADVKEKTKTTNLERYGVENPSQVESVQIKRRNTFIENYGVDHPMKTHGVKEKSKKTMLERYGVEHPMKSEKFKEKRVLTSLERYGVGHHMMLDETKEKRKETFLERYGATSYSCAHITREALELLDDPEWMEEKYKELGGIQLGNLLGVNHTTVYGRLKMHGIQIDPKEGTSFGERQVSSFIESLGFEVVTSERSVLNTKELDIFIPSKNVAIEYNGVFWHSDRFKDKNYHLEKTTLCSAAGVRLLHLFEDEWLTRQDQVKSKIKSILGVDDRKKVYARKCEVVVMNNKNVKDFYEENHIQGHVNATIVLGLKSGDELVAAMSFKHTRGYMELVRYATSHRVVGGFSKLLKHFWKMNQGVDRIVSFADIRWSDGGMYTNNGWIHVGDTKPNYYYTKRDERFLKQNFKKEKIRDKYPEVYSDSKTEREMMMELGFDRIYDCGLLKFEMKKPS